MTSEPPSSSSPSSDRPVSSGGSSSAGRRAQGGETSLRIPPPIDSGTGIDSAPLSVRRARGSARTVRFFERLAHLQAHHPVVVLCIGALSVALALMLAMKLGFKSSFGELLPENKESVIIARQVSERLPSASTLTVVASGKDNEGLKRFVDALAPELRKLPPELVGNVDDGVRESQKFFEANRYLYAPLDLVQQIHDEIKERYDYEVSKAAGFLLDDEEREPITEQTIRKRIEERTKPKEGQAPSSPSYPGGYYLDEENHVIAVLIRTSVSSGDLERSEALKKTVRSVIDRVDPTRFDPAIEIGFTGNLITSAEEYARVTGDLAHVGFWGVVAIISVVFLFYLRLRTVIAMTLSVGIGTAWTFGVAYLLIGYLNTSTGFLVSIVVGNGINFGIIYMARYLEARRDRLAERSLFVAHRETWLSTLTASAAATAAYGSLVVTDFRGFKHFGIIGGSGMLLCWIATYLFLPSILIVAESIRPLRQSTGLLPKLRGLYGRPFAALVDRFPRVIATLGIALTVGAGVLAYRFVVADDPMEYDMDNIANAPETPPGELPKSEARRLGRKVDKIVGRQGQDGIAVMTERLEQVLPLKAELNRRRDAAPADRKPFDKVVTIFDLLPSDQDVKIALVDATRGLLEKAHRKGFVKDEDWRKIQAELPVGKLETIGVDDLPEQVARSFLEIDGTRGRLVYIVPATGRSVWDAHYLIEWAESFRTVPLPDGSVVKGSGHSVIFADLIMAVVEDAPKAIIVSLAATLLIVLIAFRGRPSGLLVMGAVLAGLVWLLGALALWKTEWSTLGKPEFALTALKLNFLNFVALPITIGVGADYAVNVVQRYRLGGRRDIRQVIVETGGAVILCSLTTTLGYLALTLSINRAIQSFGIAAALGELFTLVTGVLVLPSLLSWHGRRRDRRKAAAKANVERATSRAS